MQEADLQTHRRAVHLRQEALDKWLERGAQTSDTVASLLRKQRRIAAAAPPVDGAEA